MLFVIAAPLVPVEAALRFRAPVCAPMLGGLRAAVRTRFEVIGAENFPAVPHVALWKHSSAWETFGQFLIGPPKAMC